MGCDAEHEVDGLLELFSRQRPCLAAGQKQGLRISRQLVGTWRLRGERVETGRRDEPYQGA